MRKSIYESFIYSINIVSMMIYFISSVNFDIVKVVVMLPLYFSDILYTFKNDFITKIK